MGFSRLLPYLPLSLPQILSLLLQKHNLQVTAAAVKHHFTGSVCIFCSYEEIFSDSSFIVENGLSSMKFVVQTNGRLLWHEGAVSYRRDVWGCQETESCFVYSVITSWRGYFWIFISFECGALLLADRVGGGIAAVASCLIRPSSNCPEELEYGAVYWFIYFISHFYLFSGLKV